MMMMEGKSIPKIIHYCWFGSNSMDEIHKQCLKSWKKNLPGFQFMKWDESNIDFTHHPFLNTAYEMKKWAFVADYIRLQKLYEYGGIYLDTDMLLLKPLDEFLLLDSFFGAENRNYISCGIIGSRRDNSFLNKCLLKYDELNINDLTDFTGITVPQLITSTFKTTYNFTGDFTIIVEVPGITIFPPVYFYSLPYKDRDNNNKKKNINSQSYAIHLWDESWKDLNEFQLLRKRKYLKGFKKISKNNKAYSFTYFKKVFSALIKSRI